MADRGARQTRAVDGALWTCSALLGLAILGLSLGRPPDVPGFHFVAADKVGHVLAYGLLAGTLLLAGMWRPGRGRGVLATPWLVIGPVIVFGGLIEIAQVGAGRNADGMDLVADALGALGALAIWTWVRARAETAPD